jgi:hypothetical protein
MWLLIGLIIFIIGAKWDNDRAKKREIQEKWEKKYPPEYYY